MKMQKIGLFLTTISTALLLIWQPLPTHGANILETLTPGPRPTITPIPRQTLLPTPQIQVSPELTPHETFTENNENGAHIELQTNLVAGSSWTEVEWQDSEGSWHVVQGWRGYSRQGITRWFVSTTDFHKGPFRWLVYDYEAGKILAFSNTFYLPSTEEQTIIVKLQITQ